jgi:hypothetical protein
MIEVGVEGSRMCPWEEEEKVGGSLGWGAREDAGGSCAGAGCGNEAEAEAEPVASVEPIAIVMLCACSFT